jgi:hypothetical protein
MLSLSAASSQGLVARMRDLDHQGALPSLLNKWLREARPKRSGVAAFVPFAS